VKPIRIAVDLRSLTPVPSGVGFFALSMLRELSASKRLEIIGLTHRPVDCAEEFAGSRVRFLTLPSKQGSYWQQVHVPRWLAGNGVDLFWSPTMTIPLRLPCPSVLTVHDLSPMLYPETLPLKSRLSIHPLLRPSIESADRVVTGSESSAADLRFHFPQCTDDIRVIPYGVDPAFRPADPVRVSEIRTELKCPGGYLLHVGTLEPRKNVGNLLDAWKALRKDDPATPPLVIAGGYGWRSRSMVKKLRAAEAEGLIHLGRVEHDRLIGLYQAASLFVFPSLYEGFGLPILEAMACGVPAVASDSSSLPEVMGDAGVLFDPEDTGGIAHAIRHVLSNPRLAADLGARGIERAQGFRWPTAARQLEDVFCELIRIESTLSEERSGNTRPV